MHRSRVNNTRTPKSDKSATINIFGMLVRLVSNRFGGERLSYGEISIEVETPNNGTFPKTFSCETVAQLKEQVRKFVEEVADETGATENVHSVIGEALLDKLLVRGA